MKKSYLISIFLSISTFTTSFQINAAPINQIDYFSLSGTGLIDFESVPTSGGSTIFDGVLSLSGASFSERFIGQSLSFSGSSDILSGSPDSLLILQTGATNENIIVAEAGPNKGIAGLGVGGLNGEGALSILFDSSQSEIGIIALGGDLGAATFEFWKSDGTLIDTLTLSTLGSINYFGFGRDGGSTDIAGVSIWNTDPGGIGYDDIIYNVATVPVPASIWLFFTGLLTLIGTARRKHNKLL